MKPALELDNLMIKAQQISEGILNEIELSFRDKTFNKTNLEEGYNYFYTEREKLYNGEQFIEWDKEFCSTYYKKALKINKDEYLLSLTKRVFKYPY